jgi:hypothetical protein
MSYRAANRAAEASSGGGAAPRTAQQLEAGSGAAAAAPPADPRIEIGSLLSVRKYEDALVKALNTASLDVLVWACKQVRGLLVGWDAAMGRGMVGGMCRLAVMCWCGCAAR